MILFTNNLGEVKFSDIWRSLLISIVLTAFFLLLSWLGFRDWGRAALFASLTMILVLVYGHVYDGFKETDILVPFARHRFLLSLNAVFILGVALILWRKVKNTEAIETFFVWFSVFTMIVPMYRVATYYLKPFERGSNENRTTETGSLGPSGDMQGDIYYIILDEYGREDTLREYYDFDNSGFVNQLSGLGFYVASYATSNYPQTLLSLGATLNLQYLDETLSLIDPSTSDRRILIDLVAHNRVREILGDAGYKFVAFDSGYVTSIEDADIYYKYLTPKDPEHTVILSMNSFEGLMFEKSILRPLLDFGLIPQSSMSGLLEAPYMRHAERILFAFDKLAQIPHLEGKHFVFAHIVAPHPPFVFGPNGEFISHTGTYKLGEIADFDGARDDYISSYKDEVTYINSLVLRTVTKIIAESDTPPIIIIQGDHGPSAYLDWASREKTNMKDRFSILSAFYLGGEESNYLYPSISSVNTFRVVLDEYFGMDMPMLPDRNYFSLWKIPFQLEDVTDGVTAK